MAQRTLDQAMAGPGVVGAMCVDAEGLCLGSRGEADPDLLALVCLFLLGAWARTAANASSTSKSSSESPESSM